MTNLIVFGKNESRFLGEGWHERETDQRVGFPYRATKKQAALKISLQKNARSLSILIAAPTELVGKPQTGLLILESTENGSSKEYLDLKRIHDRWGLVTIQVPECKTEQMDFSLVFKANHSAIPDQKLGNGDRREFGWMVSAIWAK